MQSLYTAYVVTIVLFEKALTEQFFSSHLHKNMQQQWQLYQRRLLLCKCSCQDSHVYSKSPPEASGISLPSLHVEHIHMYMYVSQILQPMGSRNSQAHIVTQLCNKPLHDIAILLSCMFPPHSVTPTILISFLLHTFSAPFALTPLLLSSAQQASASPQL